ncbi:amidotransferase (plasmid) [Rhodococcus pyridinivorans SB3094]|uniref:Amidotransferase n=1 Tax=Rhodococcus pyridinivorans SB3094 TaxID=1435356 RepID=V9XQ57_9NOCA|nr:MULTISPECIES: gamma-glutamyl-gamma-aminobutyrate hydrolase family protein [Rhodococcus]AHD24135.1 amidotransferase [Rhodococcus pyridinivorans SB3094]AYA23261.1 gamma-glutamyl-gamma-aminobutyrate hydrolase family protein [Rhodococcus rhodochrous]QSE72382.1 gamma-glutamyl-gamma-aminobutyrate hydrolase family protein [Rhodococcus sp. PSBB049]
MSAEIPVIAVTLDFDELPSFIHWKEMFRGVAAAGGTPVAIDCGKLRSDLPGVLRSVDGLLISGGVDVDPALYGGDRNDPRIQRINPARDENELTALELARSQEIPILAICRGAQLTNVALGGTLYADLARDWAGRTGHWHSEEALIRSLHSVQIEPDTLLSQWTGTRGAVSVNSQHHQGLKTLAAQARAAAHTDDGLIEAFEIEHERIVAVQWHPEVLWRSEPHALNLLRHFITGTRRDDKHASAATGRKVPYRQGFGDDSRFGPSAVVGEREI